MRNFKQYLNEVTLSRVFRHFKNNDIPVALITAFRGDKPYQENVKRNQTLAREIKSSGYGYVFVDGGWIETADDGTKQTVSEDSILIIGSENDNGKLKGLLKKWVKQWNQDAALFKEEGGEKIVLLFQTGKEEKLSNTFTTKKLEYGFTKLRGRGDRVFAFESAHIESGWLSQRIIDGQNNDS